MENKFINRLEEIKNEATSLLKKANDKAKIEEIRIQFLGRKGSITAAKEWIKELEPISKPTFGKKFNEVRNNVENSINNLLKNINKNSDYQKKEFIDVSMPGNNIDSANLHPISQVLSKAINIFRQMGFSLADGPIIESEWRCFDALNTPPDHPARNEQDTFYLDNGKLLRTHTSSVQIKTMEDAKSLPLRILAPGYAFRRDEIDATHLPQFTQLEGLYVANKVSISDLKGTLQFFFDSFFSDNVKVRLRPHFFPFTEPSYEIDVNLINKSKDSESSEKWIELAGCGMVDPAIFESICDFRKDKLFDPEKVTGFAFGLGIDRLAMINYEIPDIRYLIENDIRFLKQFTL